MEQKNNKSIYILFAGIIAAVFVTVAVISLLYKKNKNEIVPPVQYVEEPDPEIPSSKYAKPVDYPDEGFAFSDEMGDIVLSHNGYFYQKDITVKIHTRREGRIYYTLNGSAPDEHSSLYNPEKGISLTTGRSDDAKVYPLRAVVFYEDGSVSEEIIHSYLLGSIIDRRYENLLVFCISGNPDDLTDAPDGIFYGENYELRGRESERPVYVEILNRNGEMITAQHLGIRINGAYNRQNSQKSMKFFARKSYSPEEGTTYLNCFDLLAEDNTQIVRYDSFVLRASGNDFRFAFVRDELNHILAKDAGFTDYEPVFPAVAYMNGAYYGFFWLHGSYCDEFFKNRYGASPAETAAAGTGFNEGAFVVLAGKDRKMEVPEDDDSEAALAEEYNAGYADFSSRDLTDESNYRALREWMDVENYLAYMAYNIYLCNKDWPHNNVRCFKYVPAPGEGFGEGVYDGRWRHLLHDIDYTLGLYGQAEVMSDYNTLGTVLSGGSDRHSALLAALLERDDCKEYFVRKSLEFGIGALSATSVSAHLNTISRNREKEMDYYYDYLISLKRDDVQWIRREQLDGNLTSITDFAKYRPNNSADYLLSTLSLSGSKYRLIVNGVKGARVILNDYVAREDVTLDGIYLTTYAADITACYAEGYSFDYWDVNGTEVRTEQLHITKENLVDGAVEICLHVKKEPQMLHISEFCARSWDSVTLCNPTDSDIALGGCKLSDGSYDYVFTEDDVIHRGATLTVYCNNTDADPALERKAIFNLSEGEVLTLTDADGTILESITIPHAHDGFVFRKNAYTGEFEERR